MNPVGVDVPVAGQRRGASAATCNASAGRAESRPICGCIGGSSVSVIAVLCHDNTPILIWIYA